MGFIIFPNFYIDIPENIKNLILKYQCNPKALLDNQEIKDFAYSKYNEIKETFNETSLESLDEMICDIIQKNGFKKNNNSEIEIDLDGIEKFTLKENERIFYKFIISGDCKYEILKTLYSDGYSEEYLFP